MELLRQPPFFLGKEVLDPYLEEHEEGSLSLLENLIEDQVLPKWDACELWSNCFGIAYVEPVTTLVSHEALGMIPLEIASKAHVLPLYIFDDVLTVAMVNPADEELIVKLEQITQMRISPVFSLPVEINSAISIHYQTEEGLMDSLKELKSLDLDLSEEMTEDIIHELTENTSLIQIINSLIYFALRERASDIHIEPSEIVTMIRFRVDGILREMLNFPQKVHAAVSSRLKILCNLNIAELRFPKDGRFSLDVGTNRVDFRVSFMPTIHGEKVVIRVLGNKQEFLKLDQMMISDVILKPLRRIIKSPNGIIFVTGPTGSGKTTTLYAALEEINSSEINITTIEDPVEMQIDGISQCQVNKQIDLSFAHLLRSILRQDPDVILVGEIRDLETAKIATEAALTGHLVFATLHTNNALQAIARLVEIGVEPHQVAPSIIGVLAQRLGARICDSCKEPYYPSLETLQNYFHEEGLTEVPFYRGRGCEECRFTGFKGRISFHELALITDEMRTIIANKGDMSELLKASHKVGYRPLHYDGLKKVLLGLTTIEEIEKYATFDWS
jgi:type II secretory ATPase GspE/PulE/Tfp pilus assembly ATPase PilB-like protein